EACGEGDVADRHRRGFDQGTSGADPLGAGQGQRSDTELFLHESPELSGTVPERRGQSFDSPAIDDTVADASHGARHDGTAAGPVRRARAGSGSAPPAGAEAGLGGRRGRAEELDVRRPRRAGRTRGSAEDAGRAHGGEEHAVEAPVTGGDRLITLVSGEHVSILLAPKRNY